MGSDVSRNTVQGLGLHDLRITTDSIWDAESSYTQAEPTAGDPVDQGDSEMDLIAYGAQTDDTHLELVIVDPGMPGPAGARFIHREGTTGNYYGHVQYLAMIAPWESIVWTDGTSGTVRSTATPHSVTLADDTVCTAVDALHSLPSTTYRVMVYLRDPDSPWAWSSATVYQQDAAFTDGAWPCLLELDSGRLLCAHWIEDTTEGLAQVRIHYSDDSGATWDVYTSLALPESIDISGTPGSGAAGYILGKLRMAKLNGQIALFVGLTENDTDPAWREQQWHYCSNDLGASFALIDEFSQQANPSLASFWDVTSTATTIVMVSAGDNPVIRRLGSADAPISSAPEINPTITPDWLYILGGGGVATDGDVAICADEAGTLYVHGRDVGAASEAWCSAIRSTDDGLTWEEPGASPRGPGAWWDTEDGATYPRDFTTTVQRARVVVNHNWAANPGNEDDSLGAMYLGGYSDLTMPPLYSLLNPDQDYAAWTRTWLPFDTPDAVGWATAGLGAAVLSSGELNITTAASTKDYTRNPTGSIAQGLIVRGVFRLDSGGSLTTDDAAIRIRLADGTNDYDVSVRIASTGFRVYDNNAGSTVDTVTVTTSSYVELIVAMADDDFACWYREADTDEEQDWKAGPTDDALTSDAATPAANHMVQWGHLASAATDSAWTELHYTHLGNTGQQLIGFTNPDDLTGRELSATGTYVSESVTVAAVDGPAMLDDEWHIDTAYRYAVTNLLDSGPSKPWRSTADNQIETVALALDKTLLGTDGSMPGNDVAHLTLLDSNVEEVKFQGYDSGTSTWVDLGTFLASDGRSGLHWTRHGNTVIPTGTSGTDNPYLLHNDFAGGTFQIGSTVLRRITSHTEGRFGPGACKQTTLVLEGVTGAEAASGTAGRIWSPSMCCVAKLDGAKYAAYRLYIPAQNTADGYYQIGKLMVGEIAAFGRLPDWGRAVELQHGTEVREARDRTRRARRVAPPQRTLEIALTDGIDTTQAWKEEQPDYLYGSNGVGKQPIASAQDTPYLLEGLIRYTDGPLRELVYIPTFPVSPSTVTLTSRHSFIPMTIDSPIRLEVMLGDENIDEVVRVALISGREIVS